MGGTWGLGGLGTWGHWDWGRGDKGLEDKTYIGGQWGWGLGGEGLEEKDSTQSMKQPLRFRIRGHGGDVGTWGHGDCELGDKGLEDKDI